jgi:hypothetical protein
MAEHQLPKLTVRVRFPSSAPTRKHLVNVVVTIFGRWTQPGVCTRNVRAETDQPQVYIHGRWTASSRARKGGVLWADTEEVSGVLPAVEVSWKRADRLVGDGVRGAGGPAGQQGQGVLGG